MKIAEQQLRNEVADHLKALAAGIEQGTVLAVDFIWDGGPNIKVTLTQTEYVVGLGLG